MAETSQSTTDFHAAYQALNDEQKQAVDAIEGPVMVIAGPGTGKTQILTLRIANILLQTDTAPESILALTFTDAAAKNMRERLHRYIGQTAYRIPMYTFHGFAQHVIREYPDAFTRVIGARPASELQKIKHIETILTDPAVATLRPISHPSYYVRPLIQQISELKKENITPDRLATIVEEQARQLTEIPQYHEAGAHKGKQRGEYTDALKSLTKNQALQHVYQRYEALLQSEHLFDFEDMILETVAVLERDESVRLDLQERYQYLLADEHQDVNGAQNRILELLSNYHTRPNIFVVGDEKQAIYRFQGASLENFLHFTDLYPETEIIKLTKNYRSGPAVLEASHSLIAVPEDNPLAELRVPLSAALVSDAQVTKQQFPHEVIEEAWVVQSVQAALERGVAANEIAVIVRSNKEVEQFAHSLRAAGIPVFASADGDILDHALTHTIRSLLTAIVEPTNDAALFSVLHGAYWQIPLPDILKVLHARSREMSLYELISDSAARQQLALEDTAAVERVHTVLMKARDMAAVDNPAAVVGYVLSESGLLQHTVKHNPMDGVRVIRRLYDEIITLVAADPNVTLADVLRYFETIIDYRLPIQAPFIKLHADSVQVMTAHKAKGLEFEVVFIPHLTDNRWNGKARQQNFKVNTLHTDTGDVLDALDDERRLFYVALTRAQNAVHLSNAVQNADGKDLLEAELVLEIDATYLTTQPMAKFVEEFSIASTLTGSPKSTLAPITVIAQVLATRGFSATSFNNYMQNPWDYFYRNVLRIPEIKPLHMHFGTAVHAVLENLTKQISPTGTEPPFTDVTQALTQALTQAPLTSTEYQQLYEQGVEVLGAYLPTLVTQLAAPTHPSKTEYNVRVVLETGLTAMPELPLSGTFDRIDFDTEGRVVRIVDYKTGQPKSRNVIEGKTKHADGRYKRQLVFYALLLSLYDDEMYHQDIAYTLSFVQPAKNGTIKEESFTISQAEIDELRAEIITAVDRLMSGDWLHDTELLDASEYAQFARALLEQSHSA